jgi:GT2 family glycosyltransferase
MDVRLVTQSRGGPAAARNSGAAVARGRFLAFIDDDCVPAPDWLTVLADEMSRDGRRLLGGRVENALADNPYADASEAIGQFVYEHGMTAATKERFFTTNNFAVPLDLFRSLGGFDPAIPSATAEDKEFCDRWRARGLPLAAVPAAVVYHSHDLTFTRFLRQHFNYGRGILSFRLERRKRTPGHLVPEPVGFYIRLVLVPARARGVRRRWRRLLLLIASQLATAAGAAYQALSFPRRRRATLARRRTPTEA